MGGFPLGYTKSEFYEIIDKDGGAYLPIDLSGAIEVVLAIEPTVGVGGSICKEPLTGSPRFPITEANSPYVVHSTDDRLYFIGNGAGATLCVWVIRG